jgi:hypothetical protein
MQASPLSPHHPNTLSPNTHHPSPITPAVDNRGEKWGQVARAVDKWHNVRAPDTARTPATPCPVAR